MPESRSTILMDREAKRRRKTGEDPNVYGPNELKRPRVSLKEAGKIWARPFEMFFREPIVLCLSILSGFSDALIFTFLESFVPVYGGNFGFGILAQAWAFIPINLAYFIAYFSYWPWFRRDEQIRKKHGDDALMPERRLKWLLWLAPLEPIGLFGFAWTSMGPPQVHWIAPMIFSTLIAIANYAIYLSSVDYMIAAYGVYSASATGGNAFARDFLAGTLPSPFGKHEKQIFVWKTELTYFLFLQVSQQCTPHPSTPISAVNTPSNTPVPSSLVCPV